MTEGPLTREWDLNQVYNNPQLRRALVVIPCTVLCFYCTREVTGRSRYDSDILTGINNADPLTTLG